METRAVRFPRFTVTRNGFTFRYNRRRNEFCFASSRGKLRLACQAAVSPPGAVDFGHTWEARETSEHRGAVVWRFAARESCWQGKELVIEITDREVLFRVEVSGQGAVDRVLFFAGYPTALKPEPQATFHHLKWAQRDWRRSWTGSPLAHRSVFNPQPNLYQEQELPAACARRITCATTFGPETFNTFFAPAPYVYVFDQGFSLGVVAPPGENRYTHFDYGVADGWGLELAYDGMTRVAGKWTSATLRLGVVASSVPAPSHGWSTRGSESSGSGSLPPAGPSRSGYFQATGTPEDPYSLPPGLAAAITDYLDFLRQRHLVPPPASRAPAWSRLPMACGWGQQTAWASLAADGAALPMASPITPGANGYANQQAYTEFVRLLEAAALPYGTLTIDCGWSPCYTIPVVDQAAWPDLKGFIAAEHARGKKVLLWLATWNPKGLPPEFTMPHAKNLPDVVDPTHPGFRQRLAAAIAYCVSPDGLNADGFKLDFTGDMPRGPGYRPAGDLWGVELMLDYVRLIFDSMVAAKADTVLETHCAHPLFTNVTDLLRLNDIFSTREDVRPMMAFRAAIARLVSPNWVIDTDNDPFVSRKAWLDYMRLQPQLGIPCIYSITHMSFRRDSLPAEPIRPEDLAEIRDIWTAYRQELEMRRQE